MNDRTRGRTGVKVTRICLGTTDFGGRTCREFGDADIAIRQTTAVVHLLLG